MILVPVKNLADAKQRLSSILSPEERFALARAMCEDVLQALARWQSRPSVTVVTSDSFARDLAARFSFEVVADDNSGETSAINMATAFCRERGAENTLVVPADIPLIDSSELQEIVDCAPHSRGGAVLVPDAARRGTAKATGLPCVVLELPGIARDIDRPEDLRELAASTGDRQSQKLVRSWNLGSRNRVELCQVEHGVQQR